METLGHVIGGGGQDGWRNLKLRFSSPGHVARSDCDTVRPRLPCTAGDLASPPLNASINRHDWGEERDTPIGVHIVRRSSPIQRVSHLGTDIQEEK